MSKLPIIIDPEFKSLVPPMSADSLAQLEQNIREHGLLDRLSLWEREDGTFVLIDGHHRYDTIQRLSEEKVMDGLADGDTRVQLREADGANREAVKLWILQNQIGRRNLTEQQRIDMVAKIVVLRQQLSADVSKANLKQGTESPEPRLTQTAPVGSNVRAAAKEFDVPQRPLQAAVNAARGKSAYTPKPLPTKQCGRCGEQVTNRKPSIKKHNQEKHNLDLEFLQGPQCKATNKDGSPCIADAEENGLCVVHAETASGAIPAPHTETSEATAPGATAVIDAIVVDTPDTTEITKTYFIVQRNDEDGFVFYSGNGAWAQSIQEAWGFDNPDNKQMSRFEGAKFKFWWVKVEAKYHLTVVQPETKTAKVAA